MMARRRGSRSRMPKTSKSSRLKPGNRGGGRQEHESIVRQLSPGCSVRVNLGRLTVGTIRIPRENSMHRHRLAPARRAVPGGRGRGCPPSAQDMAVVREEPHGPQAQERPDGADLPPAGRAGVLVLHPRRRRRGAGGPRDHRPGAHVRAHGVQGHDASSAPPTTRPKKTALAKVDAAYHAYDAERRKPGGRPGEAGRAEEGVQGRAGRRRPVHREERVRRDRRPRGRRRHERVHQLRSDRVLLLAPGQQGRAVGLPRVRRASSIPCSASSTRSATSSWKSGACAPRASRSAACSSSSSRPRLSRTRTSSRSSAT